VKEVVLGIVLFLLFPALLFAQQNQPAGAKPRLKTVLDFKDELGLKPVQVDKLKVIIGDFEKAAQPLRQKIASQNREIRELLEKGVDLGVVKPKIKDNFSLRADLVIMEIEAGRKVDKELTPEQLSKWREIKKRGGK